MPEHPDRLEREIEEILKRSEGLPTPEPTPGQAFRQFLRSLAGPVAEWEHTGLRRLSRMRAMRLLLLSFVLVIVGFVLDSVLPYEGYWVTLVGCVLFVPSFAMVVFHGDHHDPPRQ